MSKLYAAAHEAKAVTISLATQDLKFHREMRATSRAHTKMLKRIAIQIDIPIEEVVAILEKDSNN